MICWTTLVHGALSDPDVAVFLNMSRLIPTLGTWCCLPQRLLPISELITTQDYGLLFLDGCLLNILVFHIFVSGPLFALRVSAKTHCANAFQGGTEFQTIMLPCVFNFRPSLRIAFTPTGLMSKMERWSWDLIGPSCSRIAVIFNHVAVTLDWGYKTRPFLSRISLSFVRVTSTMVSSHSNSNTKASTSHSSARQLSTDSFKCPPLKNPATHDVFQSIVKGRKSWKSLKGGEIVWPPELEAALIEGEFWHVPWVSPLSIVDISRRFQVLKTTSQMIRERHVFLDGFPCETDLSLTGFLRRLVSGALLNR